MIGGGDDVAFFVVGENTIIGQESLSLIYARSIVTMAFGGVHTIAWSFSFPSHAEQILWRISSIAITGIPLAFASIRYMVVIRKLKLHYSIEFILGSTAMLLVYLYAITRLILLVLSLTTLRSLPPSAFETVRWTTFFPHI
jgi:hypothetical protein